MVSYNSAYPCQFRVRTEVLLAARTLLRVLMAICFVATSNSTPSLGEPILVDRVNAIVGGEPVLFSEVQEKVANGPLVVVSDYPASEGAPAGTRALQDAINFELILQNARGLNIDVQDDEVEAEIGNFLQTRGLSKDGLLDFLSSRSQSYEDYKADFKDQMLLRRFQGRVISPLVKITDRDIETYYLTKSGGSTETVEISLRQILIEVANDANAEVADAKEELVQEVYSKLQDGLPFVEAVKIYSDDKTARANGGLMQGIHLSDLAGTIRSSVEELEVGTFTSPVRTGLGFHIFYLEKKSLQKGNDFKEKKQQLEFELRTQELNRQTRQWLADERQRTEVKILPES